MKFRTKIILSALALFLVFVWAQVVRSPDSGNFCQVYIFDVGQGDAILIQRGNYQILIDGGPDDTVLERLGSAMPATDREIEEVILTHPHSDHVRGVNLVLERFEIGKVYFSGVLGTSNEYLEFLEKINNLSVEKKVPEILENVSPFEEAKLTFIWPGDKYLNRSENNLNNTSEVIRFCYYEQCVFLTADIETDEQNVMFEELEKRGVEIGSDILKISHHGSQNGTSKGILERVNPSYGVISVGADNQFGHPHKSTIDMIIERNIQLLRTDRDGTVQFILQKEGVSLKS